MTRLRCPLCQAPLTCDPRDWHCPSGHHFDVAREGYVNLLPVQHKKSLSPGDSAESLRSRRDFLEAGHYQPLRDAVVDLLQPLAPAALLDIGSGEGYYTQAMASAAARVIGIDIAKPGIQLAARRHRTITWLVASAAALPLEDASQDAVTSLFSPLPATEIRRVLKPGGHLLAVTPAPDHLWQLREALFAEVRPHEPDKFLSPFETGFALLRQVEVRAPLRLSATDLANLVQMTPYAWKATPARREALLGQAGFTTEAAFTVLLWQRGMDDEQRPADVETDQLRGIRP